MDIYVQNQFVQLGARVMVLPQRPQGALRAPARPLLVRVDVAQDRQGEFFKLEVWPDTEVRVVDVQPAQRHLLLLARQADLKEKFLCGHDERHWFVAAVPDERGVRDVTTAREALKPEAVRLAQQGVASKALLRRKNAAYIRQGEWFFIPTPQLAPSELFVLHDEPINRGRGKSHFCEFFYREGGERVYVSRMRPRGVTEAEYRSLLAAGSRASEWRVMVRDPIAYAKGRISHPDHATITLPGWHRVVLNTENRASSMSSVVFLD